MTPKSKDEIRAFFVEELKGLIQKPATRRIAARNTSLTVFSASIAIGVITSFLSSSYGDEHIPYGTISNVFFYIIASIAFLLSLLFNTKKDARFTEVINRVSAFVHPELAHLPDKEIMSTTLEISGLFGRGAISNISYAYLDGNINGLHIQGAQYIGNDSENENNIGYFYYMPFYKDFNDNVIVQPRKQVGFAEKVIDKVIRVDRRLFDDDVFYKTFIVDADDNNTALMLLDDELRQNILAYHNLYPKASLGFARGYLFIYLPEWNRHFSQYAVHKMESSDLMQMVYIFESGPIAIEIFRLDR